MKKSMIIILFLLILLMHTNTYEKELYQINDKSLVNGYFQVMYDFNEGRNDGFKIRRTRLVLESDLSDYSRFHVEFEATQTPALNKAYLDLTGLPPFEFRIGLFKIPFSHDVLTDENKLIAIERAQMLNLIDFSEDRGMQIRVVLTPVILEAAVFNGDGKLEEDSNEGKNVSGRIFLSLNNMQFGFAGYRGYASNSGLSDNRGEVFLLIDYKRFLFEGEYIIGNFNGKEQKDWAGCYATFAYRFNRSLTGFAKYDEFADDIDTQSKCTETKDYTLGIKWNLDKHLELKINYLFRYEKNVEFRKDNNQLVTQFQVEF